MTGSGGDGSKGSGSGESAPGEPLGPPENLDDERSTEPFVEPVAGWPDDYSDPELADMIIEGLDKRHIASLVKLGFSASEMRQIGELPMSVISGKGTPERLSAEQGNRVTRMARVATLAIAVFGDCDKAWAWLRAPKNRFGNQTWLMS